MSFAPSSSRQSEPLALKGEQADALTELVNIGFGSAVAPLAELVGSYIRLTAPQLRLSEAHSVPAELVAAWGCERRVHVVRQGFMSELRGEALVVLSADDEELARLLGAAREPLSDAGRMDLILDVANILTGACVGRLSELLGTRAFYTSPRVVLFDRPITDLVEEVRGDDSLALVVQTVFEVEGSPFHGRFVLLIPSAMWKWLLASVDRVIENLA